MNDAHVGRDIATRYVTGEQDETELELRQLLYPAKCELCEVWVKKGEDALGMHPGQTSNPGTRWIWFCLPCILANTTAEKIRPVTATSAIDIFARSANVPEPVETNPFMRAGVEDKADEGVDDDDAEYEAEDEVEDPFAPSALKTAEAASEAKEVA